MKKTILATLIAATSFGATAALGDNTQGLDINNPETIITEFAKNNAVVTDTDGDGVTVGDTVEIGGKTFTKTADGFTVDAKGQTFAITNNGDDTWTFQSNELDSDFKPVAPIELVKDEDGNFLKDGKKFASNDMLKTYVVHGIKEEFGKGSYGSWDALSASEKEAAIAIAEQRFEDNNGAGKGVNRDVREHLANNNLNQRAIEKRMERKNQGLSKELLVDGKLAEGIEQSSVVDSINSRKTNNDLVYSIVDGKLMVTDTSVAATATPVEVKAEDIAAAKTAIKDSVLPEDKKANEQKQKLVDAGKLTKEQLELVVSAISDSVSEIKDTYQGTEAAVYANTQAAIDDRQDAQIDANTLSINDLYNQVDRLDEKMDGVMASTQAVTAARPYMGANQTNAIGVGLGHAGDAQSMAIGYGHRMNENWTANANVSITTASDTDVSVGAGVGYAW
ncbi:YadA C-terminal domain-containing protein [Vibrio kyushuensis]|uniref:YadA C-terminal domain-containing protein n=1 Tax=Vibrio kyushuensis TaxID=2910249 RepID=UPI003D119575